MAEQFSITSSGLRFPAVYEPRPLIGNPTDLRFGISTDLSDIDAALASEIEERGHRLSSRRETLRFTSRIRFRVFEVDGRYENLRDFFTLADAANVRRDTALNGAPAVIDVGWIKVHPPSDRGFQAHEQLFPVALHLSVNDLRFDR